LSYNRTKRLERIREHVEGLLDWAHDRHGLAGVNVAIGLLCALVVELLYLVATAPDSTLLAIIFFVVLLK